MRDYVQKEGQGSLFKNHRKETERHPDYNGSITIDGVERWISAWIKDGKDGKFMSLSLGKPKEERPAHKVNGPASSDPDLNDDIPF